MKITRLRHLTNNPARCWRGMMSTLAQLINADLEESGARRYRYWKASRLPIIERYNRRPKPKRSPRDRVLKRLMGISMSQFTNFTWFKR